MSTLNVSTIQSLAAATLPVVNDSAGTEYGRFCRAFVNFNGTGAVGANQTIRASFNVTTVGKNATGDYTVNFTNSLPDANYSISGSASRGATNDPNGQNAGGYTLVANDIATARTSGLCRVAVLTNNGDGFFDGRVDSTVVNMQCFR